QCGRPRRRGPCDDPRGGALPGRPPEGGAGSGIPRLLVPRHHPERALGSGRAGRTRAGDPGRRHHGTGELRPPGRVVRTRRPVLPPASTPLAGEAAFTLMEVLVALLLLGLVGVACLQLVGGGLRLVRNAGDHVDATLLADAKLAELMPSDLVEGTTE